MKDSILLKKAHLLAKEAYSGRYARYIEHPARYRISRKFPRDEMFCLTSQLRRAVLSVPLNIVEGFARLMKNENRRFLEIAYASSKEVKLYFAYSENYLEESEYMEIISLSEEVGRILWTNMNYHDYPPAIA